MAAILLDNSRVVPVCPTNTAEVVQLIRSCAASLMSTGIHFEDGSTVVEYVVSNLVESLKTVGNGIVLLMVQQIEFTDTDLKVRMRGLPSRSGDEDGPFSSVDNALKQTIRRDIGQDIGIIASHNITLMELVVVTNEDKASGQISHPNMLTDELEKVENACLSGKIKTEDQVQFLASLEEACLKANRAGATIAAVTILDIVDSDCKRVEFESFYTDSEELFLVEKENRRGSETCVSITVRQHDMPR